MPHILKARQFGVEAVIITERTVKCCSCNSERRLGFVLVVGNKN